MAHLDNNTTGCKTLTAFNYFEGTLYCVSKLMIQKVIFTTHIDQQSLVRVPLSISKQFSQLLLKIHRWMICDFAKTCLIHELIYSLVKCLRCIKHVQDDNLRWYITRHHCKTLYFTSTCVLHRGIRFYTVFNSLDSDLILEL